MTILVTTGALSETHTENNINPEAAMLTMDSRASESKATELEIEYATIFMQKMEIPQNMAKSAT